MSVRSILPYLVEEYKYLCCIVNEHGQCRRVALHQQWQFTALLNSLLLYKPIGLTRSVVA